MKNDDILAAVRTTLRDPEVLEELSHAICDHLLAALRDSPSSPYVTAVPQTCGAGIEDGGGPSGAGGGASESLPPTAWTTTVSLEEELRSSESRELDGEP
jgi:hypothetical protein